MAVGRRGHGAAVSGQRVGRGQPRHEGARVHRLGLQVRVGRDVLEAHAEVEREPRTGVPAIVRIRRRRGDVDCRAARRHPGRQPARAGREDRDQPAVGVERRLAGSRPAGSRSGRCSRSTSASCRSCGSNEVLGARLELVAAEALACPAGRTRWRSPDGCCGRPGSFESKYGLLYSALAGHARGRAAGQERRVMDVVRGAAVVGHLPGLLRVLRGREGAAGEHAAPGRHGEAVVGGRRGQRARVDGVRGARPSN